MADFALAVAAAAEGAEAQERARAEAGPHGRPAREGRHAEAAAEPQNEDLRGLTAGGGQDGTGIQDVYVYFDDQDPPRRLAGEAKNLTRPGGRGRT